MKVRLLGLAVVLVALAVIVNALAISSASVTNGVTVSVVATNAALLAFDTTGVGNDPDLAVSGTTTGSMTITIDDGIQKNSSYTFSPAFMIKNNSDDTLDISIPPVTVNGVTMTATAVAGGDVSSFTDVPAGKTVFVSLTLGADGSATTPTGFNLVVNATR
ncbi:MAG TPA: hypothetical protein VK464_24150 [Symbiobacteriaceae bacterium]|jgi:hypothetical protein|nr:hypothetical protein [Symbiobacteriaceae bacterium]